MLIYRSLLRTTRNTLSSFPISSLITRSISTKMATSQTATIPQSQRMFDGGTHKLDVWSIFTYVSAFSFTEIIALVEPSQIHFPWDSLHDVIFDLIARAHAPTADPANTQSRQRPFRLHQPRSRIHELGTTRMAPRTISRINGQRCHVEPLRPPKRSTKVTQSNLETLLRFFRESSQRRQRTRQ